MIYTVTINPSIDYIMHVESFEPDRVNRSSGEKIYVGGKGINVSYVLNQFGIKSTILGFCAGFTGKYIKDELAVLGLNQKMIQLESGISRINVKLKGSDETEINGQGPEISEEDMVQFYKIIDLIEDGDVLVLAGSASPSLKADIYKKILDRLSRKKIISVVDATGELLTDTLECQPFLIKPNIYELEQIAGVKLTSLDDISLYASKLVDKGAHNVIVSMGQKGAMLINGSGSIYCPARKGNAINSTGAGDSMVAGFIYSYLTKKDIEKSFRFAVETGTIAAFSEGLPQKEDLKKISI